MQYTCAADDGNKPLEVGDLVKYIRASKEGHKYVYQYQVYKVLDTSYGGPDYIKIANLDNTPFTPATYGGYYVASRENLRFVTRPLVKD